MTLPDYLKLLIDTTTRGITTATRVSADILRSIGTTPPPVTSDGVDAWREKVAGYLREFLEIPEELISGTPLSPVVNRAVGVVQAVQPNEEPIGPDAVRARFRALLERSVEVDDEAGEPGFLDVVGAMTPDEARIVRHLAANGAAATLSLYSVTNVGRGSEKILENVCLLAEHAGCINPGRVDFYLENLARLGVIAFSPHEVDDDGQYLLLQGMPRYKDEATRLRDASGVRPKGVNGSVNLTSFGREFVDLCLGPTV